MEVFDFPQYSVEWWDIRRGKVTASRGDKIVTPKQWKPATSQSTLIHEMVSEVINPYWRPDDNYISSAAERGAIYEDSDRAAYAFDKGVQVDQVGFCLSDCGRFGCSPDGLVGDDGGLELKHVDPKTQVEYLLNGGLPDKYKPQVHLSLLVTGRKWWDFQSSCPGFPTLLVRVEPTSETEKLKVELEKFWTKYQAALSRVRSLEVAKPLESDYVCPF